MARDWWQPNLGHWAPNHSERVIGRLEADVFPRISITLKHCALVENTVYMEKDKN
ncbi:hypothetical protein [Cellvibrio sp.]|uniref:hypothetical protein n=1 Tax=Cellvibrio sp. TaxID=1965322 RepID=UPI00374F5CE8